LHLFVFLLLIFLKKEKNKVLIEECRKWLGVI